MSAAVAPSCACAWSGCGCGCCSCEGSAAVDRAVEEGDVFLRAWCVLVLVLVRVSACLLGRSRRRRRHSDSRRHLVAACDEGGGGTARLVGGGGRCTVLAKRCGAPAPLTLTLSQARERGGARGHLKRATLPRAGPRWRGSGPEAASGTPRRNPLRGGALRLPRGTSACAAPTRPNGSGTPRAETVRGWGRAAQRPPAPRPLLIQ